MSKNTFDYFENLKNKNLVEKDQNLIYDNDRIDMKFVNKPNALEYFIQLTIDNNRYFYKRVNRDFSIAEIASANMYNEIGIITPPVYTIEIPAQLGLNKHIVLATQDVESAKNISCTIAYHSIPLETFLKLKSSPNKRSWEPLYNEDIKEKFLEHMTPECFEDLTTLFLADEIRTECDRHRGNYFFYKTNNSEKYEGIIPIDHEFLEILQFKGIFKQGFFDFLTHQYSSTNMCEGYEVKSYLARLHEIYNLIQDQKLSNKQIECLKSAINYNFPKEIEHIGNNPYLINHKKRAYDSISELWDYHQKNLGRELGL